MKSWADVTEAISAYRAKQASADIDDASTQVSTAQPVAAKNPSASRGTKVWLTVSDQDCNQAGAGDPSPLVERAKQELMAAVDREAQTVAASDLSAPFGEASRGTKVASGSRAETYDGAELSGESAANTAASTLPRAKLEAPAEARTPAQAVASKEVKAERTAKRRGTKVGASASDVPPPDTSDALSDLPAPAPLTRMGRPTEFTSQVEEKVCMLVSLGFSRRQAAAYLGIGRMVISRAAQRDAELAKNLRRAEEMRIVQPLLTIHGHSRKNWRAATWLIEHLRKHPPRHCREETESRDAAEA